MTGKCYIAYYRVSTEKQTDDKEKEEDRTTGLGLEAQEAAVNRFLASAGGQLIDAFTEVESGRKATNRPKLAEALARCRKTKATLIIAKLDRLARSVHFISGLMKSKVEFLCCDNPYLRNDSPTNKLMLHQLAAFAEFERDMISQRTKEALAVLKARGVKLGNPEFPRINEERRRSADEFAGALAPIIAQIKAEGYTTLDSILDQLNRRDVPTARGGRWHRTTVFNLVKRIERISA